MATLVAENLTYSYTKKSKPALNKVSVEIKPGTLTALVGPNGAGKSMGLTTVYRNLQILIKHGLIRSRHLPNGEVLYTPVDRDIHHLTCVQCGETSKMEGCPVKDIHTPKKNPKKFQLLFHTLEYFGLCQNCYQAQN